MNIQNEYVSLKQYAVYYREAGALLRSGFRAKTDVAAVSFVKAEIHRFTKAKEIYGESPEFVALYRIRSFLPDKKIEV